MRIVLITGGARSGKSRYAAGEAARLGGDRVTFVATAEAADEEMADRIRAHRAERPTAWETVEAPHRAGVAVGSAAHDVVLLDCLTLLVSNAMLDAPESREDALAAARAEVTALLTSAEGTDGTLLVVTNEVGCGVVPPTALGRWFRDAQGEANRRVAERAERVVLLVSGVAWAVKGS